MGDGSGSELGHRMLAGGFANELANASCVVAKSPPGNTLCGLFSREFRGCGDAALTWFLMWLLSR
jgi:hypothetical protein